MTDLNTANARGWVVGLPSFGVVPRQDIDVLLSKETDAFNLFVLALRELQLEKPGQNAPLWQNKMAFYQMAGIHGLPNSPWDNIQSKDIVNNRNGSGYCNHSSPTFPTWHRPYLAMFEQALYQKMLDVAGQYTDATRRKAYQEAVRRFRLPYIDYHRPRNYNTTFPGVVDPNKGSTFYPYDFSLPQVLTLENITVRMFPADNITTLPNPLAHFIYPAGSMSDSDWDVSGISPNVDMKKQTMRYPLNRFSKYDPLTALNAAVNEIREDSIRLSLLFVENGAYNGYEDFATNGARVKDPFDGKTVSGSLESIHGNYHVYIGGSGHMSSVPTAAFDPIFWMHHCTIDRWFAIWQKAHPNSWFADRDLARAGLVPFRNPANQGSQPYWSSETAGSTEAFGYTYPELVGSPQPAALQRTWKDQYAWARRLTAKSQADVKPPPEFMPLDLSKAQIFQGIKEFKPLNKPNSNTSNVLLPDVKNLMVQPLRRAMAVPAQMPLAVAPAQVVTAAANVISSTAKAVGVEPPQAVVSATSAKVPATTAPQPISSAPGKPIDESKVSREWYVDDVIERLALNTSFTILYFIGNLENSGSLVGLLMAPTFAGLNHVFAAPVEACDNCQQQQGVAHLIRSTSPITSILLDYVSTGELASMRTEHVRPFLVKNLKWRVVTVDGRVINPRDLSANHGFKNSVSCKVSPLPGQVGEVVYETYSDIPVEIIRNAT